MKEMGLLFLSRITIEIFGRNYRFICFLGLFFFSAFFDYCYGLCLFKLSDLGVWKCACYFHS